MSVELVSVVLVSKMFVELFVEFVAVEGGGDKTLVGAIVGAAVPGANSAGGADGMRENSSEDTLVSFISTMRSVLDLSSKSVTSRANNSFNCFSTSNGSTSSMVYNLYTIAGGKSDKERSGSSSCRMQLLTKQRFQLTRDLQLQYSIARQSTRCNLFGTQLRQ